MIPAPDIPGHSITGVLGTGGFATVYRGWQVAVGREVAVKVDSRMLHTERDQRRFFREVTAAGLSGHPHVIDIYDAGTLVDGRPYLVMELCPAGSLNDQLRQHGPMSPARVRGIGISMADALAAAHAAGVLHRDIKPANILINRYGVVGLSDFGLASIIAATGEQSVTRDALTPAYAPPESFRLDEPTAAADVYSLAATLYALLAWPPRFPADARLPGVATILSLHDKPVDDVPGAPPELLAILRQCLAADPALRLPTAATLRDALAALAPGPGRPLRPLAPAGPGGPQAPAACAGPPSPASAPTMTVPPAVPRPRSPVGSGPAEPTELPAPDLVPSGTGRTGGTGGTGARSHSAARASHAASQAPRRQPAAWAAILVGSLALVFAAAVGIRTFLHAPNGSGRAGTPAAAGDRPMDPGPVPGVFGTPTVTGGCPAASVRAAAARCPKDPECWDGTVDISGSVTARSLPCSQPHSWETFAIAIMPSSVATFDQDIVDTNPSVRAVCSLSVLLRSRQGKARLIPAQDWEIQVMPPDEAAYDSGARAYRCIATTVTGPNPGTSEFVR